MSRARARWCNALQWCGLFLMLLAAGTACHQAGEGEERPRYHTSRFFVVNTTEVAANDLHLTISGTGGSLRNPRMDPDGPHCDPPPGQPRAGGNKVDVTWATPCVLPGDTLGIRVEALFPNLQLVGVVWTLNGDTIR